MIEQAKAVGDVAAVGVTIGVVAQWLPPIAALLTIIYTGLRIYEWFERRRRERKHECQTKRDDD